MNKKKNRYRTDLLPPGRGWLYVEFGAYTRTEADAQAQALIARLSTVRPSPTMKWIDDPADVKAVWEIRESALAATAFVPG